MFVDRCTFSLGHCVVCSSSIYGFGLPLWYLQTLLSHCLGPFDWYHIWQTECPVALTMPVLRHSSNWVLNVPPSPWNTWKWENIIMTIPHNECHIALIILYKNARCIWLFNTRVHCTLVVALSECTVSSIHTRWE